MTDRLKYILNIVIIALLLGAVTIRRDGSVFGQKVEDIATMCSGSNGSQEVETKGPERKRNHDDIRVINSSTLAEDVVGFGGATPVEVYIRGEIIEKVVFLDNVETPSYMAMVVESGLQDKWNGMPLTEATTATFDGVSGATYSYNALVQNVQRAAAYALKIEKPAPKSFLADIGIKEVVGLLVLLFGVVLTFVKRKNKGLVIVGQVLNVAILGFWCGSFLSMTSFLAWVSNGINLSVAIVTIAMLVITIVMPLFGKKGTYCQLHCPMGSAQELMSLVPIKKVKIPQQLAKFLNSLRYYILITLLTIMWLGVGFELIDYEIFSAFMVDTASTFVLVLGIVFLLLSLVMPRPYCRMICPTGALLTMSQKK